jgi:hypothetical protein
VPPGLPEVSRVYRNGAAEPVSALDDLLLPTRVLKRCSAR